MVRKLGLLFALCAGACATATVAPAPGAPSSPLARAAPAALCTTAPTGMVGWWAGDGNANDISGSGNNGAFQNGASTGPAFVADGFTLNGSNWVEIPDAGSLHPTSFSVDTWVRFASFPGISVVIAKPVSQPSIRDSFSIHLHGNALYVGVSDASSLSEYNTGVGLGAGVWYHVAFTYDNPGTGQQKTVRVYVNGSSVLTTTTMQEIAYDGSPLLIGADLENGTPNYGLNGVADEVELFSRVLTDTEIRDIAGAGSAGKCKPGGPPGQACAPVPSGMLGWWSGEGNAEDRSANNNDGALVGDTSFAVAKVGQSFALDGNGDYVTVPDSTSLRPTSYTVDGWFRATNLGNLIAFVGKGFGTGVDDSYGLYSSGGTFWTNITGPGAGEQTFNSGFPLASGAWYFLAVTFDQPTRAITMYVNGSVVGTFQTAIGTTPAYDSTPLTIGADIQNTVPQFFMQGQADEVEVIDHALTTEEVAALFATGAGGKCTGATRVAVRSFTARRVSRHVELTWRTAAEAGLAGFDVFRRAEGRFEQVNRRLVLARGAAAGNTYRLVDLHRSGVYRLRVTRTDGTRYWFSQVAAR